MGAPQRSTSALSPHSLGDLIQGAQPLVTTPLILSPDLQSHLDVWSEHLKLNPPPPWPEPGSGHLSHGQPPWLLPGLPAATFAPTVHFYTAARVILLGHEMLSVQNRGVGKQVEAGVYPALHTCIGLGMLCHPPGFSHLDPPKSPGRAERGPLRSDQGWRS